jgi:L-amino acid N-acyltransferase YncA
VIAQYSPTLKKATFENIYVAPEHRKDVYEGTSISRALGENLVERLREVGATSINGIIEKDNHASRNYASRLGFESEGDFVWMRREL